jgi:hypothetical protein
MFTHYLILSEWQRVRVLFHQWADAHNAHPTAPFSPIPREAAGQLLDELRALPLTESVMELYQIIGVINMAQLTHSEVDDLDDALDGPLFKLARATCEN